MINLINQIEKHSNSNLPNRKKLPIVNVSEAHS